MYTYTMCIYVPMLYNALTIKLILQYVFSHTHKTLNPYKLKITEPFQLALAYQWLLLNFWYILTKVFNMPALFQIQQEKKQNRHGSWFFWSLYLGENMDNNIENWMNVLRDGLQIGAQLRPYTRGGYLSWHLRTEQWTRDTQVWKEEQQIRRPFRGPRERW